MKKLFFLTIILSFVFVFSLNAQIQITTADGKEYQGIVLREAGDSVVIRTISGNDFTIPKTMIDDTQPCTTRISVLVISTAKKPKYKSYEGTLTDITDSSFTIVSKSHLTNVVSRKYVNSITIIPEKGLKTYAMTGLTLLQPGGLNLLYGYQFSDLGFRVEAGYIRTILGYQANFMYNLGKSRNFEHNLSLGVGYSFLSETNEPYHHTPSRDWLYGGLFYDMNLYGIFLEFGLTMGSGSFKNPQLSFQFGYVLRLNK